MFENDSLTVTEKPGERKIQATSNGYEFETTLLRETKNAEGDPNINNKNINLEYPFQKIVIYVDEIAQKIYIDTLCAHQIGLNTNGIVSEDVYLEITSKQLEKLLPLYEVEYKSVDMTSKRIIPLDYKLYNDTNYKDNQSEIAELRELRDKIVENNINNQSNNIKYSNEIEAFIPKK